MPRNAKGLKSDEPRIPTRRDANPDRSGREEESRPSSTAKTKNQETREPLMDANARESEKPIALVLQA